MKTKIVSIIALVFMGITTMHGQIDRSKQPTPGEAPKINIEKPRTFTLSNGLEVMVVENHKLPRASMNLTLDNPPVAEGSKVGVSDLTGGLLGNGSKTITKDAFNEEVDYMGAHINISSTGGYASGLSKYFNRLTELLADAAINPNFTQEEFDKEKDQMIEGIKSSEKNVKSAANRVKYLLAYGKEHPYGEFVTKESLEGITLADVKKHYINHFVPGNAYLVVIGDVKFKDVKETITKYFSTWRKGLAPAITIPTPQNVQYTQVAFVDMPNAVQSEISVINTVDFKMSDEDYHAALIANKILGGDFNSYLNQNLREAHGWTYGARSSLRADEDTQALFSTSTSVRNAVTDSAIVETLKEINKIRTVDVSEKHLANVKAKYLGDFVIAMEKPETIARYALNIETNNLSKDFYKTFLKKINAVTVADVKRVANKYFKANNLRVVVAGKGADVIPNLEKVMYNGKKLPIRYFDKYGNPTVKPVFSKEIPKGITAQTIIEKYIAAIGGRKALEAVKTLTLTGDMNIMGQQMGLSIKRMLPNKEIMEITHPQMGVVMKQVFDGEKGYMKQGPNQKPMSEKEVAEAKKKTDIFEELSLDMKNVSLAALTTIEGKDAYKLKVINGKDIEFRFYDAKTGYLVRTETTKKIGDKEFLMATDFGSYTPTSGIQFPFSMTTKQGPQTFGMLIKKVLVNEGVSDADFK